MSIEIGDSVAWTWGNGLAEGVVEDICPKRVEIISKGKKIIRNGTPDNPALIIKHVSGNSVLKLHSEVQKT